MALNEIEQKIRSAKTKKSPVILLRINQEYKKMAVEYIDSVIDIEYEIAAEHVRHKKRVMELLCQLESSQIFRKTLDINNKRESWLIWNALQNERDIRERLLSDEKKKSAEILKNLKEKQTLYEQQFKQYVSSIKSKE